jgi:EmrB/QacA subfamily drug resistance transporter
MRIPAIEMIPVLMIISMQWLIRDDRRRWAALAVVCLGQLMMILDATIVNVALPSIQADLRFSQAGLTWVLDAYMIAFGSFLLLAGRLGDLVGRRRIFLSGLVVFTAASAACGLAQDQTALIAARFLQGLGGAIASAVILAIIVTDFREPRERATAMSVYTFIVSSGGSIGLLAGGSLTEALGWHWIFFVNLPIGALAFVLGRILIEESPALGLRRGVDWLGAVLVTGATMLVVYAIVKAAEYGWGSAHTLGFAGAGAILLGAFAVLESRLRQPLFPPRILRVRGLMVSSVVRGFLITGMFSTFVLGSLYLERVRGYGALQTGLAFLPMTLVMGAMSLGPAARVMARFGPPRMLFAGLGIIVLALLGLSRLGAGSAYAPDVLVPFLLLGLGAGLAFLPLMTVAMADVPATDAGLASGIVNASLQISAAVGVATLGTIAAGRADALVDGGAGLDRALTAGYTLAWEIGAVSVSAAVVIAVALLGGGGRPRLRTRTAEVAEAV